MRSILKLLRVKQWIKNGFLFLPLFFDQKLTDLDCLSETTLGFISFSFFASSIYVLNDYMDREKDRLHPKKKDRPIAAGAISPGNALVIMGIMLALALGLTFFFLPVSFFIYTLVYLGLNFGYSLGLKHLPIVDVTILALGYVLRVFAGAVICNISPSVWLITMTFLLAFFIGLAKRRDDVLLYLSSGTKTRPVVDGYNIQFLNIAMSIMASVIIVAYLMYTITPEVQARFHTNKLYFSGLFVILGLLRYLQIALVEEDSGAPTEIFYRDRFLQLTILGWVGINVALIYFHW